MKIILTGSTGFLGGHLLKALSAHEVITVGRNSCDFFYDFALPISNLPCGDLIIHAAGKAHSIPKTEMEKKEFYASNLELTINLLKSLESSGLPSYFVFISTVAVYGLDKGELINENSPLLALEPYGKSKIDAENAISNWCQKNEVMCTILRLPLIAGENPPGNLKAMINGIKHKYYFNIGKGETRRSMVLATDIAENITRVALVGGTYNLTDGLHPSFLELSKLIACQLKVSKPLSLPITIARLIAKIGDVFGNKFPYNTNRLDKMLSTITFDDRKARLAFNWEPHSVLNDFKIQ